jgi:hypothetical protein
VKLWLLTQYKCCDYDTYDAVVVAAETEEAAKRIRPNGTIINDEEYSESEDEDSAWGSWPEHTRYITAECLGEAEPEIEAGVILASFNAG